VVCFCLYLVNSFFGKLKPGEQRGTIPVTQKNRHIEKRKKITPAQPVSPIQAGFAFADRMLFVLIALLPGKGISMNH
jgi:hypothetical protein